ncbi:hypothetical protein [Frankia sp. Cr1]|uniref:hypothetical protein n=1 Tax=Frankia sp. Cr1 TaxID=3073931 RepID=UPI002AD43E69|nr:hypothetical protein [Frankia sp. Cr1]
MSRTARHRRGACTNWPAFADANRLLKAQSRKTRSFSTKRAMSAVRTYIGAQALELL